MPSRYAALGSVVAVEGAMQTRGANEHRVVVHAPVVDAGFAHRVEHVTALGQDSGLGESDPGVGGAGQSFCRGFAGDGWRAAGFCLPGRVNRTRDCACPRPAFFNTLSLRLQRKHLQTEIDESRAPFFTTFVRPLLVRRLDHPAMKVSALILACLLLASPCLRAQVPFRAPPPGPPGLPDQIILAGDFISLGPLPFTKGMTAVQAVLQTGGIIDSAPAKLYLIRCGKAERIDLRAVLAGDPSKDRTLQPWDILYLNPHRRLTTRSSEQAGR